MPKPKRKTSKGSGGRSKLSPKVKPPKKRTLKQLKAELWELCKQITRKRYVQWDGTWKCYTCGSVIDDPGKAHTGHCINSSVGGMLLRYHLDNLRVQDYRCNINLGSNGAVFLYKLQQEIGQERVDALFELKKQELNREVTGFLEEKIAEYKLILASL